MMRSGLSEKLFSAKFFSATLALSVALPAWASAPRVLHQTSGAVIVRLGADDADLVWQEVGSKKSENTLFAIDLRTLRKSELSTGKRPFGPSVAGGHVFFGAGHLNDKVDAVIASLHSDKAFRLHKLIPWIIEPSLQVRDGKLEAVWERALNIDGDGLAIYLWRGDRSGKGEFKVLADGPVLRKADIPKELHRLVHNEYPEISGDSVVFQNNEFGTPNIYRLEMKTGAVARLAASTRHQERPAVDGPLTAWEESESGFATSNASAIFLHDAREGKVRKVNAEMGFHYQARVFGDYVIYGAKREPLAHTPSLRVYDAAARVEYQVQNCFAGAIYDWAATKAGLYVAQRVAGSSSRLLFASWEQLRSECR